MCDLHSKVTWYPTLIDIVHVYLDKVQLLPVSASFSCAWVRFTLWEKTAPAPSKHYLLYINDDGRIRLKVRKCQVTTKVTLKYFKGDFNDTQVFAKTSTLFELKKWKCCCNGWAGRGGISIEKNRQYWWEYTFCYIITVIKVPFYFAQANQVKLMVNHFDAYMYIICSLLTSASYGTTKKYCFLTTEDDSSNTRQMYQGAGVLKSNKTYSLIIIIWMEISMKYQQIDIIKTFLYKCTRIHVVVLDHLIRQVCAPSS